MAIFSGDACSCRIMAVQFSRKELAGVRFLVGALMSSDNLDRVMRDLERVLNLFQPQNFYTDEAERVYRRTYSRTYDSFFEPKVNWMRDGF